MERAKRRACQAEGAVCAKALGHERTRPIRSERRPGNWGEQSVGSRQAFMEGNMDFILSVIGSYPRVISREVT